MLITLLERLNTLWHRPGLWLARRTRHFWVAFHTALFDGIAIGFIMIAATYVFMAMHAVFVLEVASFPIISAISYGVDRGREHLLTKPRRDFEKLVNES